MSDNPLAPLARLRNRTAEVIRKELGLVQQFFGVEPGRDPAGAHEARMIFVLDEDRPVQVVTQDAAEFDALTDSFSQTANEEKAAESRADLERLRQELKDPRKGIGLDD